MGKTLLYRLFGIGRIPARVRPALEAERIAISEEGVRGSITYRDYTAPRKRFGLRRIGFTGSLAVTGARFVGFAYDRNIVNLAFDDPRLASVEVRVEPGEVLCVALDAHDFHAERSGRLEFRYHVEKPREFAAHFARTA